MYGCPYDVVISGEASKPEHEARPETPSDYAAEDGFGPVDAGVEPAELDELTADAGAHTETRRDDAVTGAGNVVADVSDAGEPDSGEPESEPSCTSVYFLDADGDGHGDESQAITACYAPAGYVALGGDCYDVNAKAKPGQEGRESVDRGDGSFDYDCDGLETPRVDHFAYCPELDDSCPPPNHWPDGFECDYTGMVNGLGDYNNGWSPFPDPVVCDSQPCPEPQPQTIPDCGEIAAWGVRIAWAGDHYACKPPLFNVTQRQTCR